MKGRALQDNAGFSSGGPGVGSTWKPGVKLVHLLGEVQSGSANVAADLQVA